MIIYNLRRYSISPMCTGASNGQARLIM